MNSTPDSVQPDPRDIAPDGFRARVDGDDVEGHRVASHADAEPGPEGLRVLADEDDAEGHYFDRK